MKKYCIFALAALLVVAFTLPAAAVENQFGGFWRTRFYTQKNFTGEDTLESRDRSAVDTRSRFNWTAVLNDNLKFRNEFEFNTVWGDTVAGDMGTDGAGIWLIRRSEVEFTLMENFQFNIGLQPLTQSRGFMFADTFAGMIVTYKGDNFTVPFIWLKAFEGTPSAKQDSNDDDVDVYILDPKFNINDVKVNPFVAYATSDNVNSWNSFTNLNSVGSPMATFAGFNDFDLWYMGINLDYVADGWNVWGTFIWENGDVTQTATNAEFDIQGYLFAIGGGIDFNNANIHGQFFHATGDDNPGDLEVNDFFVPGNTGNSYYWAEIMGLGVFDQQGPAGGPADEITNISVFNVGATFKIYEDFSVAVDVWDATLAENDGNGNDDLGTELDVTVNYQLVEGLTLTAVGAYLWEGAATYTGANEADPYEVGLRLQLSF